VFVPLGDKNGDYFDTRAESLFEKVNAFQSDDSRGRRAVLSKGIAKLFDAPIPLTLYNAYSHLLEPHDLTRL
jgi:hypothetical protein